MAPLGLSSFRAGTVGCLCLILLIAVATGTSEDESDPEPADMVLVKGSTFTMGDVFGDGKENERPTHEVTLSDFYVGKHEVTIAQFSRFVEDTGYKTSAEAPDDPAARKKIMEQFASGGLTEPQMQDLHVRFLKLGGAGYWDSEGRRWTGYNPETNWLNPGFEQADSHPVQAVSRDDAIHYCNWLSEKEGRPVAYDLETGAILDKDGNPTTDVTAVKGYRLPTEAEWEYAAREGGRKVRFGNGKDIARSTEMNFRGDEGDFEYLEPGEYVGRTMPVGSYPPNSLGLCDMAGNAWEWVSDTHADYVAEAQVNPYATSGAGHTLRGGRWGGDASAARVFHRSSWPRNDRCNNSGFRIARSAN